MAFSLLRPAAAPPAARPGLVRICKRQAARPSAPPRRQTAALPNGEELDAERVAAIEEEISRQVREESPLKRTRAVGARGTPNFTAIPPRAT